MPIGDIHLGHKETNEHLVKTYLDWAKKRKYCLVLGMGDLMETGVKTSYGLWDQKTHPNQQFKDVIKLFKPLKKRLIGLLDGNHEQRIYKRTGFNVTEQLSAQLKTPYLGVGKFITIKVKKDDLKQEYTFYATHGSSAAWTLGGKINAGIRMARGYVADCLLHAHIHLLFTFNLSQYKPVGKDVILSDFKVVYTGSFVEHANTYVHVKGMPPTSLGCPRIELHADMHKMVVKL